MTEASAGLKTSNVLPDPAETHLPPIKFNFGGFSHLTTPELMAGVARLPGFWPFPWLPLGRLLTAEVWRRRCEVVIVFIGLNWFEHVLVENVKTYNQSVKRSTILFRSISEQTGWIRLRSPQVSRQKLNFEGSR
jgi:hypothetical protein